MTDASRFDPADLAALTDAERAELDRLLTADGKLWRPLPGPQTAAFLSAADVTGYGGAAGGAKTDLICGLSLEHERVLIVRREKAQTEGIVQRLGKIIGSTDGYTSQHSRWQVPAGSRPLIEFGGLDAPGDEARWQGRPHDLIAFDEATEMREGQVRTLLGWNRTDRPGQRCRAVLTFNPPMSVEGRWVVSFFAPWLDKKHTRPAVDGELRWFSTIEGKDREVPDSRPFVIVSGEPVYDFDPARVRPEDIIRPLSRTFFSSRVTDNPHLMATGYLSVLQGMPEPKRSRLLYGDFHALTEDDPMQVIPTAWVEAAQARWVRPNPLPEMDSVGVDVALGGRDQTVIVCRHGHWLAAPIVYEGSRCIDGPTVAGFITAAQRNFAPIHLDLFGVGAQPYGHLMAMHAPVVGVGMGETTHGVANDSRQRFANKRSELWWRMREALDPAAPLQLHLPPGREVLADLTAPTYTERAGGVIQVEGRESLVVKLGRSPDVGTACILALMHSPWLRAPDTFEQQRPCDPVGDYEATWRRGAARAAGYDPMAQFESWRRR